LWWWPNGQKCHLNYPPFGIESRCSQIAS
jgi:hypothetical protein